MTPSLKKELMGEKVSNKEGHLTSEVDYEHLKTLSTHWNLIHTLLNYKARS